MIAAKHPFVEGEGFVKRVLGMPGDYVVVEGGGKGGSVEEEEGDGGRKGGSGSGSGKRIVLAWLNRSIRQRPFYSACSLVRYVQ